MAATMKMPIRINFNRSHPRTIPSPSATASVTHPAHALGLSLRKEEYEMSMTIENAAKQLTMKSTGLKMVLPMKQMMRPDIKKRANIAHLLLLNHSHIALSFPHPVLLLKLPTRDEGSPVRLPSLNRLPESSHKMFNLRL